ncbi:hypothetical protein C8R46DRAFT_1077661 [Mycena filopes]|nr:hypothetical protein C8R46DRAFT_1077661 [Mycena filopes]
MGSPHSFIGVLSVLAVLLLLLCAPSANGAVTNTTFDDTSSAFTFTGSWTATSAANPCAGCSSKPDASQTFGGTWHDGNYRTGAPETTGGSFTFTGSAVHIFGIDQAKSQPDIAFTLGNVQSTHHYTGTERFVYNALFFSATGLAADQTHTVNWIFNIDPSTGVGVQAALFDYAVVTSGTDTTVVASQAAKALCVSSSSVQVLPTTQKATTSVPTALNTLATVTIPGAITTLTPESASSSSKHSSTGAIVGAVIGALLLCALLFFILLCRRRRRRRTGMGVDPERRLKNSTLQPFVYDRPPDVPLANPFALGMGSAGVRPAVSTLDTSMAGPGGASAPSALTSASPFDGAPPAFVDAAGAGRYPPEKIPMQEIGYTNTNATPQVSVSRQPSHLTRQAQADVDKEAAELESADGGTMLSGTASEAYTSARERYLEERLATLEAHVASYLPPPYEHAE